MNYEKTIGGLGHKNNNSNNKNSVERFWNDRIMERFIKANLFIICCVAAGLLLIVYLGAFSCEVSWILEAHGDLPFSAFILCTQYFLVFVATTILIHGLVTGLSWGLFAWSVVIGLLSIPELIFVMIMTTQHWGLQSLHGLTELITYLVRLVINCFALLCVIPTAIRWRRESQVFTQLQDLATRLQLQTPPPSVPITKADSRRSSQRLANCGAFENIGYQVNESQHLKGGPIMPGGQPQPMNLFSNNNNPLFGSQNEFNASLFAQPFAQQQYRHAHAAGLMLGGGGRNGSRAQSLMDLRCTLPGMYNPRYALDTESGKYLNINIDDLKNNLQDSSAHKAQTPSLIGSANNDPIYCSIEPKQETPPPPLSQQQHHHQKHQQSQPHGRHAAPPVKLSRNCISLENLDGIAKVQNDLAAYGNNLLQNYTEQQQYYLAMLGSYMNSAANQQLNSSNLKLYRRPVSMGSASQLHHGGGGGYSGTVLAQPMQRRGSQPPLPYYGGFGYANYTNPYIMANSKLSLGNDSDDYRKYRDVAL